MRGRRIRFWRKRAAKALGLQLGQGLMEQGITHSKGGHRVRSQQCEQPANPWVVGQGGGTRLCRRSRVEGITKTKGQSFLRGALRENEPANIEAGTSESGNRTTGDERDERDESANKKQKTTRNEFFVFSRCSS